MHWKIARDKYYSVLCERYGEAYVERAGFFHDTETYDFDIMNTLDIMCTPYHFMEERLSIAKKPCIIVTTGALSPVHSGHLEMMTATKEKLESLGWDVVGGYFSPGNDEYIKSKLGNEAIPIHYRIKYINDLISKTDWLRVDTWPGIFRDCDINFTDVVFRLEEYLTKHLGVRLPVFYVCGADNARFAKTFALKGFCAVAARNPEHEENFREIRNILSSRIITVAKTDMTSSTVVRKNNKWEEKKKDVVVRIDDGDGMWDLNRQLIKTIVSRFNGFDLRFTSNQSKEFEGLDSENIITLDPYTKSAHEISVSRMYDCFGMNILGYCSRPGKDTLDLQIDKIQSGNYFLHDDDVHTGETIKFVKNLLEQKFISITGVISYTRSDDGQEIIDARDLMYGTENGGLVVMQPDGSNKRVPYIYPFVCPFSRASVNDPFEFSIEVWEINANWYKEKDIDKYEDCLNYIELLTKIKSHK